MFGYDYGIKPKIMIVGDVEFSNYLHKANIYGIGYMSIPENALQNRPLKIALIFNNEEYGRKSMQSFHNWINNSDKNEDAFVMDIIEREDGGYTLCFYQDIECTIRRNIPDQLRKWVTPMITNIVHYKEIDSISDYYSKFKNALKFTECHICGGTKNKQFIEFPDIIKKKINIYKEKNIPQGTPIAMGYRAKNAHINREEFDKIQQENLEQDREAGLKYFFPITYDKILKKNFCKDVVQELLLSYEKTIVVQAICNLILFHRLKVEGKLEILQKDYYMNILEYLLDNYESLRSCFPDESEITKDLILEQIELDNKVRIKEFNIKENYYD